MHSHSQIPRFKILRKTKSKKYFRWAVLRTTSPWRFDWPHSMQPKSHASKMWATYGMSLCITKVDPCFDNCAIIWRDAVCMELYDSVECGWTTTNLFILRRTSDHMSGCGRKRRVTRWLKTYPWVWMGAATFAGPNDEMKWTWNQAKLKRLKLKKRYISL